ncbi:MAG: hypothetical protein K2P84_07620, partial [Undibacterium sp.]|nr:hypothetical protein [Undibacterium sp.]
MNFLPFSTSTKIAALFVASLLCACGGKSNTSTATTSTPASAPSLTAISISPSPATISIAGTQQFTASGSYSDGSTAAITKDLVW